MVGIHDHHTAAFKDWWDNDASVAGGILVYNTGRFVNLVGVPFSKIWVALSMMGVNFKIL